MKLLTRILASSLVALAAAPALVAQEIQPVWVQHLNGLVNVAPENKIPILVKAGGSGDDTYGFDGTDVIDSYVNLLKYDDNRYLLGIRENGINEQDPTLSQAQKDLAAAYPDRSIIWIDAATGKPMGLALKTEIVPVPLAAQPTVYAWWKYGITDGPHGEKVIYTGFRYKILRYAPTGTVQDPAWPNGRPTWSATPTEAWVEPVPGEPSGDESSGGDGSASWRWKAFRVTGHGPTTQLWVGGGTWRASMQPQQFVTDDSGLTFRPIARMDDRDSGGDKGTYSLGGQPSSIVSSLQDPARPGLQVSYQGHFPGTGWEGRPNRYTKNPNGDGTPPRQGGTGRPDFFDRDEAAGGSLPAFVWEAAGKDGLPLNHAVDGVAYYDGNWVMTLDAKDGLDYVVSYAIPSWNQQFGTVGSPNAIFKPGWIGIHTLDGQIASGNSAVQLPFYETDEPIVDPAGNGGTGHDYAYEGDITVYPISGAAANSGRSLVLWAGGSYGFGVFEIENVAPAITSNPVSLTVEENRPASLVAVVTGSPNKYQWAKDGVDLTPTNTYKATLFEGVNKSTLTILSAQLADSGSYVLKVTNPLGSVQTTPVTLTVQSDTIAPTIAGVTAGKSPSVSYLTVVFSEPVTPETAGVAGNYRLNSGATVTSATVTSPTTVSLNTSALTSGNAYTLTVSGVRDASAAGNLIAANSTAAFTLPGLTQGFLLWEMYQGADGSGIDGVIYDDLLNDGSYPDLASRRVPITAFTTAPSLDNVAERFGARVSGWLTPTETADYRFFIASDDGSALYLSPNDNPAGAALIATEPNCCSGFLEPTDAEGNVNPETSEPVRLVAGTSYFIYAIYKEGGGGDNLRVAWRKEGDTTPAASLTPIPGSFFKSYVAQAAEFGDVTLANGQVTISWTGSGTLQESTDLRTWTPVAGSPTSPYSTSVSGADMKFYRLAQ